MPALVFLIFFAEKVLIDRLILTVEGKAYTLFDLKKDCIFSSLLNDKFSWKLCSSDESLKEHFEGFLNKALLLASMGDEAKLMLSNGELEAAENDIIMRCGGEEHVKKVLEESGLRMEDLLRWIKENLMIKSYTERRFKGRGDALRDYLETLKRTMKIRVYFDGKQLH